MRSVLATCVAVALVWAQGSASYPSPTPNGTELPVIDLGYELHQAASYNATTDVYTFANIRYARPPVGDLRFRAPLPPTPDRSRVQKGSVPRTCPQGLPDWQLRVAVPVAEYENGKPFTLAAFEADIANATAPGGFDLNQGVTEDCLFLDVFVPRKVLESTKQDRTGRRGAPVLAWIHGGGYTLGSKAGIFTPQFDPSGLLAKGADAGGLVYVALNYRLGAFGWLAGPDVAAHGTLNAGLHDQRLALEWIQQKIALFGGAPGRVTVMGESAGGASVELQITAFGGARGPAPFAQAIPQSPGVVPLLTQIPGTTADFLVRANVSTVAEARKLPTEALIQANAQQVAAGPLTSFVYGPVVDGDFAPAPPSKLLQRGAFDRSVKLLTGQNALEGGFFYNPSVRTEADLRGWLQATAPGLSPAQQDYALRRLYPPVFDGSLGYVDQATRQIVLIGDAFFDCNTFFLHDAFGAKGYGYEFAVTPGLHGQDLAYTFNNPTSPAFVPAAQDALQQAIVSFTIDGVPKIDGIGPFPRWGADQRLVNITSDGNSISRGGINETRCRWWREAS